MNFPIQILPLELQDLVLKVVPYDEALKSIQITKWIRAYFLRNGPFLRPIKKMTLRWNQNLQDAKKIEIFVEQSGNKGVIHESLSTNEYHLFQRIHFCKHLSINHLIPSGIREDEVDAEDLFKFLPSTRYLDEFSIQGLQLAKLTFQSLKLVESPRVVACFAPSPTTHINDDDEAIYETLQHFCQQSQELNLVNFMPLEPFRWIAKLSFIHTSYFIKSLPRFKRHTECMVRGLAAEIVREGIAIYLSGLAPSQIQESYWEISEEILKCPDWNEVPSVVAIPKTRDEWMDYCRKMRYFGKREAIGMRFYTRTRPLNQRIPLQTIGFCYLNQIMPLLRIHILNGD